MIHAYHVVIGAYGFWLPNDPRGSWSEFVGAWELVRFGQSTKSIDRIELTPEQEHERRMAKRSLKYPAVQFTGAQAKGIGEAFGESSTKNNYSIWACAILPEHTHLVIARHTIEVESIVNKLKGRATSKLISKNLHPFALIADTASPLPRMWARNMWKVYLDSEEAIYEAIQYVRDNPIKEGKPEQRWPWVRPFGGLESGWVTYH